MIGRIIYIIRRRRIDYCTRKATKWQHCVNTLENNKDVLDHIYALGSCNKRRDYWLEKSKRIQDKIIKF